MSGVVERLRDGFPTIINLPGANVTFWEKSVQPPGLDGGEPIDTTTMRNSKVRTKAPRKLYDVTPIEVNAAYDPTVYDTIKAQLNQNQAITTTLPDGAVISWWGYLKSFVPESNEEGKEPMARMTLVPTNIDNEGVEQVPTIATGTGTGA
jgi:hypothetical protein